MKTFNQFMEDTKLQPVMVRAAMLFVELDIEPVSYLDEWVKTDPSLEVAWLEYMNEQMLAKSQLDPYRTRGRQAQAQPTQQPVATTAAQWPSMAPSAAAPVDLSADASATPAPAGSTPPPTAQGQQASPWQTAWSGIKQGAQQMWQGLTGPEAKFNSASKALNNLVASLQQSPGMEKMVDSKGQPLLNTIQDLVKSLEAQKGQIPRYQAQQATGAMVQPGAVAPA